MILTVPIYIELPTDKIDYELIHRRIEGILGLEDLKFDSKGDERAEIEIDPRSYRNASAKPDGQASNGEVILYRYDFADMAIFFEDGIGESISICEPRTSFEGLLKTWDYVSDEINDNPGATAKEIMDTFGKINDWE